MNVKVFSLMSKVNETRFLVQHQSSKRKCRLDESVCNSKQNGIMMNVAVSITIRLLEFL